MKVLIGPETPLIEIVTHYPGSERLLGDGPYDGLTVRESAERSNAPLAALLHELREFACDAENENHGCDPAASHAPIPGTPAEPPAWVKTSRLRFDLDADAMLASGDHPMVVVRQCIAQLQPGEYIRLTATFRPAPLIQVIQNSGCRVAETLPAPDRLETFISR